MRIEVLLATYNASKYLREQLDSLISQTYKNWQITIRDDGSTDCTLSILMDYSERYPKNIFLLKPDGNRLGAAANFEFLLKNASCDYIMFCDQDDVWMKYKMELFVSRMREIESEYGRDTPVLVFSDLIVVDAKLQVISESLWRYQKLDPRLAKNWKTALAQNVVTGCATIINRAARNIVLPFPVKEMLHDHWITAKIARHGVVDFIKAPTVLYRQHTLNVDGAKNFGIRYAIEKIPVIKEIYRRYDVCVKNIDKSSSAMSILILKILINIKRLVYS